MTLNSPPNLVKIAHMSTIMISTKMDGSEFQSPAAAGCGQERYRIPSGASVIPCGTLLRNNGAAFSAAP